APLRVSLPENETVVYVGLRYAERSRELQPAVLDPSFAHSGQCFPSRTVQSAAPVLSVTPFPDLADPFRDLLQCLDEASSPSELQRRLCECLLSGWRS